MLDAYGVTGGPVNLAFVVWSRQGLNIRARLILLNGNETFTLVTKHRGRNDTL